MNTRPITAPNNQIMDLIKANIPVGTYSNVQVYNVQHNFFGGGAEATISIVLSPHNNVAFKIIGKIIQLLKDFSLLTGFPLNGNAVIESLLGRVSPEGVANIRTAFENSLYIKIFLAINNDSVEMEVG